MKKILIVLFLFAGVFSLATEAGAITVPGVAYTSGKKSSILDISCLSNTCVATGVNLMFTSTDKGKTWKKTLNKKVLPVTNDAQGGSAIGSVDCVTGLCVATGSGGLILRSTDGGKNWNFIKNILSDADQPYFPSAIFGVDCLDKNICYTVGENYSSGSATPETLAKALGFMILKTIDGGLSWNAVATEKMKMDMLSRYDLSSTGVPNMVARSYTVGEEMPIASMQKILCKSEMECFAIGQKRSFYHTTDGWKTMSLQRFEIDNPIKAYNSDGSVVYIQNGVMSSTPVKNARYGFTGISFTADGGILIDDMSDQSNNVYKSLDNGNTWNEKTVPLPASPKNYGGALSCVGKMCLIVTQNSSGKIDILTSLDNGNTWKNKVYKKAMSVIGADCVDANTCFAVGDAGMMGTIIRVK